ncbi:hypothetical protein ACFFMP_02600 [Pseudoroseomonas cervicalis]|uniref:hypothetical protein n=1 Tax=Teichococcus cervicalis TaxID=204525 RepID=UPI0035ED2AB0
MCASWPPPTATWGAEARAGRFREDLYFRLDVVRLHIPPLRERRGDILPLADLFAARFAEINGLPRRPLSAEARRALLAHDWPGNVRELENALHRAVLMAGGEEIGAAAIELRRAPPAAQPAESPAAGRRRPAPASTPASRCPPPGGAAPPRRPGSRRWSAAGWRRSSAT